MIQNPAIIEKLNHKTEKDIELRELIKSLLESEADGRSYNKRSYEIELSKYNQKKKLKGEAGKNEI